LVIEPTFWKSCINVYPFTTTNAILYDGIVLPMELAISLALAFSFLITNVATSRVSAESGVGKDVFKIVVNLYVITDSTKDIITIANVGDQTKVKLYNGENTTSDKVSYVLPFPGPP